MLIQALLMLMLDRTLSQTWNTIMAYWTMPSWRHSGTLQPGVSLCTAMLPPSYIAKVKAGKHGTQIISPEHGLVDGVRLAAALSTQGFRRMNRDSGCTYNEEK